MLNRKIFRQLEQWLASGSKKAAFLDGARQVGKTTSVREFARRHFKYFVEVNFIKNPVARQAFDGNLDTRTIVRNLSVMGFGPFVKGSTLVFFDEIQECPNARTAIKFLVEDAEYSFIESGSLLGINYKGDEEGKSVVSSYPVGFETRMNVYPLDFEEFLWACGIGQDIIDVLRDSYRKQVPVPQFIHDRIMGYFRQYLIVGGMPEAVQTFVTEEDFRKVEAVHKDIVASYRDDIAKYAGKDKVLAKRVFDAIPSQLAKQDKRFVLAELEKGASRRKYEDPTQWLIDAGDAYYSFNTTNLELPFSLYENRKLYKLYMVDTGLVSHMMLGSMQFSVLNGDLSVNGGALTENYVAAELACKGIGLHYYDRKSKQELDFIFEEDGLITVLEVKSGTSYRKHSSLDAALRDNPDRIGRAIVLSSNNVETSDSVLYLPLYMTMFL